jgi:hypothetical protein
MEHGEQIFHTGLSLLVGVDPEFGMQVGRDPEENQRLIERATRLVILSSDAPEWAMTMERPALTRAVPICCG